MFVRPAVQADRRWRVALLTEHFGSPIVVGHGVVYAAAALPGLVCIDSAGHRAGPLSYRIADGELEVVSIDATTPRPGTGTALLEAAVSVARSERAVGHGWLPLTTISTRCGSSSGAAGAWSGSAAVRSTRPEC
jgi:hypothetical protein